MPGLIGIDNRDREDSCLQVHLFGHPHINWQGQQIQIPRARVRAIFYYLSIRPHIVTRSELIYLFWPDIPERTARRNLSHVLTHLRRALPLQLINAKGRNHISLDHNQIVSDVHNFEQVCKHAMVSMKTADLEDATKLRPYPFLSGCEVANAPNFDDWVTHIRLEHEKAILNVLRILVERYSETSRYRQAIDAATSYLEIDPLSEEMHRTIIKISTLTGDFSSAIRQYRLCAEILHRELEIEPSTETWASFRSIQGKIHGDEQESSKLPEVARYRRIEIPFVGRRKSLARLSATFRKTPLDGPSVVFISGEPGIGKTALLKYFTTSHMSDATILFGAGYPGAEIIPYQTILQAFRSCNFLDQSLKNLAPRYQGMAGLILPETRKHLAHPSQSIMALPEEAQPLLFEALWQILLNLQAHKQTILFCIDDLHWTDKATIACLNYFLARNAAPIFKMLATYRTELALNVSDLRHHLIRRNLLSEIKLEGLSFQAIKEITESMAIADEDSDALPRKLLQISGGNPLFLSETLATISADPRPLPILMKLSSMELPSSLRDAILRRLDRLPRNHRRILEAGAVLGTEFDIDLAVGTSGRPELETVDALENLAENQILESDGQSWSFQHNLLQRVALENIKPARKRILNRRAANAMVKLNRDDFTRTAHYFLHGGAIIQAILHFNLAAEQYQGEFAWHEAEIHFTQCLELLKEPSTGWTEKEIQDQKLQLLSKRARMRQLRGDIPGRMADLQAMIKLEPGLANPIDCLPITVDRIHYLNLDHEYEQALDLGESTLLHANQLEGNPAWISFLIELGKTHYELGNPQPALELLNHALDLHAHCPEMYQQGRIHHLLARLHSNLGQMPDALQNLQHALRFHTKSEDQHGIFVDNLKFCTIYLKLGDFEAAEQSYKTAETLSSRYVSPSVKIDRLSTQALIDLHVGAYATSASYFIEAWQIHDSLQSHRMTAPPEPIIYGWSLTQLHLGSSPPAITCLKSAMAGCHCRQRGGILITLGLHELATDHPRIALSHFKEAIDLAKHACECIENHALAQAGLARVKRRLKQTDQAIAEARQAGEIAADLPFPHCKILAFFELAYAYHLGDQQAQALSSIRNALDLTGDHLQAWLGNEQIHTLYARILEAAGDHPEAENALRTARDIRREKAAAILDADQRQTYLQKNCGV